MNARATTLELRGALRGDGVATRRREERDDGGGGRRRDRCDHDPGVTRVAEPGQHRVLLFERALAHPNGSNANLVLGQASYTTNLAGSGAGGLKMPAALATDGRRLWAAV